nr:NTP-binding domain [Camellia virus A]
LHGMSKFRSSGVAEGDGDSWFGSTLASLVMGPASTEALKDLDVKNVVTVVNKCAEFKDIDVGALTTLIKKLVPLVDSLQERTEESKRLIEKSADAADEVSTLGSYANSLCEMIRNACKKSCFGWVFDQYSDGNLCLALFGSLLILIIGLLWWRLTDGVGWIVRVATGACLLWAPLLGFECIKMFNWLKEKLMKVQRGEEPSKENNVRSGESRVCARGKTEADIEFYLDKFMDYAEVIVGAILAMVALFVLKVMPSDSQIKSWTDSIGDLGKKARNWTSIGNFFNMLGPWTKGLASKIVAWIQGLRGKESLTTADKQMSAIVKFSITEWINEVTELNLEENKWTGVSSDERVEKVRQLFDRSMVIQSVLINNSLPGSAVSVIRSAHDKVIKLVNETYSARGLGMPRVDPIHFAFLGKPGVGKSALVQNFVKDLLDTMKVPRKDRTYSRSCSDQYWSRYYGQPCVIYDDLGALTGDPSFTDYGEFINLKANVPYALNMAELESKGTMFRSKYLVSTSNNFFLDNNTNLRTPDAFYRRRDFAVVLRRDERVAQNPDRPLDGLLFTIVDTFTGLVRREWPIWIPEFEGLVVCDVTYAEFLAVSIKFTRAYMKVQETLVKGMTQDAEEVAEETLDNQLQHLLVNKSHRSFSDDEMSSDGVSTEVDFPSMEEFFGKPQKRKGRRGAGQAEGDGKLQNGKVVMFEKPVVFANSKLLMDYFDECGITADQLMKSLEVHGGMYVECWKGQSCSTWMGCASLLCSCGNDIDYCDGSIVWQLAEHMRFTRLTDDDGNSCCWIARRDGCIVLRGVPKEAFVFFMGIYQIYILEGKTMGKCPVSMITSEIKPDVVEEEKSKAEIILEEMNPYKMLHKNGDWFVWEYPALASSSKTVYAKFRGIPLMFNNNRYFIGDCDWRNLSMDFSVSDCQWSMGVLAKEGISKLVVSCCNDLDDLDLILIKQIIVSVENDVSQLIGESKHKSDLDTLGKFGPGVAVHPIICLLMLAKICESGRMKNRRCSMNVVNERLLKSREVFLEEQKTLLSKASPWMRNLLVASVVLGGTCVLAGAVYGVVKGISGFFSLFKGASEIEGKKVVLEEAKVTSAELAANSVVKFEAGKVVHEGGTFGNSGDQKTVRFKRRILRVSNTKQAFRPEGDTTIGVSIEKDQIVDLHPTAIDVVMLTVAKGVGLDLADDDLGKEIQKKHRIFSDCERWQQKFKKKFGCNLDYAVGEFAPKLLIDNPDSCLMELNGTRFVMDKKQA